MLGRNADLIVYGIVNNAVSKFDLEDYRIIFLVITVVIISYIPIQYKNMLKSKIKNLLYKKPSIVKINYEEYSNKKFDALVDHIISNNYCRETMELTTGGAGIIQPCQIDEFIVNEKLKIYGSIIIKEKELKSERSCRIATCVYLTLHSYHSTNKEINVWINQLTEEFRKKIKNEFKEKQKVIQVSYNFLEKKLKAVQTDFFSNINFNNNYIPHQDEIIKRIDFFNNKEFFKGKGIKRSLNFLFSGSPGTGKTAMIKAIAQYTKRHIITIKLSDDFDEIKLEEILVGIIGDLVTFELEEIIFVIEEIDLLSNIFNDRKKDDKSIEESKNANLKEEIKKQHRSLGIILNSIDGIPETDGRIIIMTTNCPEKIDTALKRPGRLEPYKFNRLSKIEVIKTCKKFWKDFDFDEKNIKDEIDEKYTSAELMNLNLINHNDFEKVKKILIK